MNTTIRDMVLGNFGQQFNAIQAAAYEKERKAFETKIRLAKPDICQQLLADEVESVEREQRLHIKDLIILDVRAASLFSDDDSKFIHLFGE